LRAMGTLSNTGIPCLSTRSCSIIWPVVRSSYSLNKQYYKLVNTMSKQTHGHLALIQPHDRQYDSSPQTVLSEQEIYCLQLRINTAKTQKWLTLCLLQFFNCRCCMCSKS